MTTYYYKSESDRIYASRSSDSGLLNWARLTARDGAAAYKAQCAAELAPYFTQSTDEHGNNQNARIYCNVTKVSASGMSRTIKFYAIQDNELLHITHLIAGAGGYTMTDDGLQVNGCGMDMRFAVLDRVTGANDLDIRSI